MSSTSAKHQKCHYLFSQHGWKIYLLDISIKEKQLPVLKSRLQRESKSKGVLQTVIQNKFLVFLSTPVVRVPFSSRTKLSRLIQWYHLSLKSKKWISWCVYLMREKLASSA